MHRPPLCSSECLPRAVLFTLALSQAGTFILTLEEDFEVKPTQQKVGELSNQPLDLLIAYHLVGAMVDPLSSIISLISHPITLYFLQTNLIAIVLGFTAPNSAIRPLAFPVLLALLWHIVSNCFARTQNVFYATVLGGVMG